jgi:hypothetical protein
LPALREGITFWALGEIVKSHAGSWRTTGRRKPPESCASLVESVIDDERERDWTVRAPVAARGHQARKTAAEREESFAAWRGFLEAIATRDAVGARDRGPPLGRSAMLAFISISPTGRGGVSLFVVATARPELYEREPGGAAARGTTRQSRSRRCPSSKKRTQLIAVLLEQTVLPAATQSELLSRAGGNPL